MGFLAMRSRSSFTHNNLNVKVSVLRTFPGIDHKMVTFSICLRNKPFSLMQTDHALSSYVSARWDEIPEALRTPDRSSPFYWLAECGRKSLSKTFYQNSSIQPDQSAKPKEPSKVCQLQVELLKTKKIFNKTGDFPPLVQANSLQ